MGRVAGRGPAVGERDALVAEIRRELVGVRVGLDADSRPRRRRSVDRGFVLSDHADWPGLLASVAATRADRVLLTHGYTAVLARWLRERGIDADTLATRYEGERDDASDEPPPSPAPEATW